MNAMNMPGFAAEASLYKTIRSYQSVAARGYGSGEQRVVSQIRVGGGVKDPDALGWFCQAGCDAGLAACLTACVLGNFGPDCQQLCEAGHAICSGYCGGSVLA